MRDRLILISVIALIWLAIRGIQFIVPMQSLYIVMGLIVLYTVFMSAAFTHHSARIKKRPPKLNLEYSPTITVVIPAHNEETVIEKTVENMMQIDYDKFDILIVDDRSQDNTAEVIKAIEAKYPEKVRTLVRNKEDFPGKSAVLNDALKLIESEVLCVFDADARVKPDFIKVLLPALAPDEVGAVQARKIIINKDDNVLTRCQNNEYTLDTHFQLSRDSIQGAVELRGNGELIKREALLDIGGWNNYTITDDLDLSTKLHLGGWSVRYCPVGEVYEEGIVSLFPLIRQRRRWVEGSIRRYLDYFFDVLTSEVITLRASFDMAAYLLEFVLPVLFTITLIVQACNLFNGESDDLISTLVVSLGIGLFFFIAIVFSLRKYDKLSWGQAIKQGIETAIYMIVVWAPIVTFIVFKILFVKRDMNWGKTSHGLQAKKKKDKPQEVEADVTPADSTKA